ncbi:MAG TPA: alpha/beta hydrolase, partial [Polyangiaceae bacterium]
VWRGVIGDRGFILCPRGIPRRDVPKSADRWEYGSLKSVEAEIDAGLTALRERFGAHVDPGPMLLIGFSLGAIYGAPLALKYPERYPRVVMVEGGQGRWTWANAKRFVEGGGQRLFIACGQGACLQEAKKLGRTLEKAGLPTRSGGASKAGHTYDGEVAAAVARDFSWLVEGDPRWEGP